MGRHREASKPKSKAIVPKAVDTRPPKEVVDTTPKRILAEFGNPQALRLVPAAKDGPKVLGYTCVAAWFVESSFEDAYKFEEVVTEIGNVVTLYHGTPAKNIGAIASEGLRPGRASCMFGAGIYAGPIEKAINYTGTYGQQARYVFRVRVALGNVRNCEAAEKFNLSKLRDSGFHSVGAVAGWTASWGGTLRHSENVVYSPDQVLAEKVYEYQPARSYLEREQPKSGFCALAKERTAPLPPGSRAFQDILSKVVCGKTAANRLRTDDGNVWACVECLQRLRIKVGTRVDVKTKGGWTTVRVRGNASP